MDYITLSNKNMRIDPRTGEEMKDLLNLTFILPERFNCKMFVVTREYIARPDLISLAKYGSTDYADIICKLNGISNPFELNEGMTLALPNNDSLQMFYYDNDDIDARGGADDNKPKPKAKKEKRKTNEAVIGDKRFKIDRTNRLVIY